jgi:hypothetical protein
MLRLTVVEAVPEKGNQAESGGSCTSHFSALRL